MVILGNYNVSISCFSKNYICMQTSQEFFFGLQGRDDFLLTLLRVLEAITEEPSIIEENHKIFVSEILPSLSVLCKGSKDGDARFLCLKIWFEVVVNMLNEAPEDERRQKDLKLICGDHFVPLYPMLMDDEDPTPIYAQKLHQMLMEFNIIVHQ